MEVVQDIGDLQGPLCDLNHIERHSPGSLQMGLQGGALNKLHHQEEAVILKEGVGDFGEVGMIQPDQEARLLLVSIEGFLLLRIGLALRIDLFDREHGVQTQMLGQVDGAHTALAERANDLIAPVQDGAVL